MEIFVENNFLAEGGSLVSLESVPTYRAKAVFSLNASRQLRGTLSVEKSGELQLNNLGPASYEIYDADGALVPGLSESGIMPDVSGLYEITPVNASALVDLTHYVARVSIVFDSAIRRSAIGLIVGE